MADADTQLPFNPTTANEHWFDALVRHQVFLLRAAGGIRNETLPILDATEPEIAGLILLGLESGTQRSVTATQKRVARVRQSAWREVNRLLKKDFDQLTDIEVNFLSDTLRRVLPFVYVPTEPDVSKILETNKFQGLTLAEWIQRNAELDIDRVTRAIQTGYTQGETPRQIVNRVIGTKAQKGRDGVTNITRAQLTTLIRTATIATSNSVRTEFLFANSDIFDEEMYVATLDSRTTPICMAGGEPVIEKRL